MMQSVAKPPHQIAKKTPSAFLVGFLLHTGVSFFILAVVAFILGYKIITSHPGNDALNALSSIVFFDKYFPNIPLWYPYQGGGLSLTFGYPQLFTYAVIFLKRLSGLTYESSMGITNFLSLLLPAWTIYLFVASRLKNKTAGFIAGFFYLVSPMPYYWIWKQGFLAQTFSILFIPLYLAFFDWFLQSLYNKRGSAGALLGLSFFGMLIFLSHPVTMLGVFAFCGLYVLVRTFLGKDAVFKARVVSGVLCLVLAGVFVLSLSAFRYFPTQSYLNFANRDIHPTIDPSTWPAFEWKGMLNLYKPSFRYLQYEDAAIAPMVWILAIVGTVLALFFNRKAASIGLVSLASLYIMSTFTVWIFLAHISFFIADFFSIRTFYPIVTVVVPIAAAFGIVLSAKLLLLPFTFFQKKLHGAWRMFSNSIAGVLYTVISLLLVAFSIVYLQRLSGFYDKRYPFDSVLGPSLAPKISILTNDHGCLGSMANFLHTSLCMQSQAGLFDAVWETVKKSLTFGKDNLKREITTIVYPADKKDVFTSENHRIDLSHMLGGTVRGWKTVSDSSIINVYTGQISLIKSYYTFFRQYFYEKGSNPTTSQLSTLGQYFGTEAIGADTTTTNTQAFKKAGWVQYGTGSIVTFFPPFQTGLVSVGQIPKVLVIGTHKKEAYKLVFAQAVSGALPFEKAILIEGPERLGDISESALFSYDVLVLHGYAYKNPESDLAALRSFVQKGGAVFIDTGWQYESPDWGKADEKGQYVTIDLPEPFPVAKTLWGTVGHTFENATLAAPFSKNISLDAFGPLAWGDTDWSVASGTQVREFAKPILSKEDAVLVAGGEYGSGRIVWSGMNLLAHAEDKKSAAEIAFLHNIFSYLLSGKQMKLTDGFLLNRPNPDTLTVTIKNPIQEGASLYFREAYYPSWAATVIHNGKKVSLPIQTAGPMFMLVFLPQLSSGDTITFSFLPPLESTIGRIVSVITIVLLLFFLFGGSLNVVFQKVNGLFGHSFKKLGNVVVRPISQMKQEFSKEEDY